MKNNAGFTLIELMVVIAIIAILSMISLPSFTKFLAKAKRSEALVNLQSAALAEKAYHAEYGKYTTNVAEDLGWKPEGNFNYTYGFGGTEGQQHYIGRLKTPASELQNAKISPDGFVIVAAGDIDGDGKADIVAIDQTGAITVIQDDLR